MSNDIEVKREAISKVYPSDKWKKMVAKMEDEQVIAIYLSFESRGILNTVIEKPYQRKMEEAQKKKQKEEQKKEEPYQITFDDILPEVGATKRKTQPKF